MKLWLCHLFHPGSQSGTLVRYKFYSAFTEAGIEAYVNGDNTVNGKTDLFILC